MNNIFILLLFSSLLVNCSNKSESPAQTTQITVMDNPIPKIKLEGLYKIDFLVTDAEVNEYTLWPSKEKFEYGNSIIFNPDGTFSSAYSAPCGNDCFTSSTGVYKWVNDTYVKLVVNTITVDGDCPNEKRRPEKDLGLFRVVQMEDGKIALVKSSGNADEDKKILEYSSILKRYDRSVLRGLRYKPGNAVNDKEIVNEAIKDNPSFDVSGVKVLYSKVVEYGYNKLVLFEYKNKRYIAAFIIHSGYVALYGQAENPVK